MSSSAVLFKNVFRPYNSLQIQYTTSAILFFSFIFSISFDELNWKRRCSVKPEFHNSSIKSVSRSSCARSKFVEKPTFGRGGTRVFLYGLLLDCSHVDGTRRNFAHPVGPLKGVMT